jgi:hypothetical protein
MILKIIKLIKNKLEIGVLIICRTQIKLYNPVAVNPAMVNHGK